MADVKSTMGDIMKGIRASWLDKERKKAAEYLVEENLAKDAAEAENSLSRLSEDEILALAAERRKKMQMAREQEEREKARQQEEEQARYLEEMEARKKEENLKRFLAKIPPRFRNASVSDFDGEGRMARLARSCIEGRSFILSGTNGIGKSHMFWAVGRHLAEKGETVTVCNAIELLSDIKNHQSKQFDVTEYITTTYVNGADRLFVDEIDKIFASEADYLYLSYIVNSRYEKMKQTVFAGNGNKDRILSCIGASAFSRLAGYDAGFVTCNEPDRRRLSDPAAGYQAATERKEERR